MRCFYSMVRMKKSFFFRTGKSRVYIRFWRLSNDKRNKSAPQGSGYAGLPLDWRRVLMYLALIYPQIPVKTLIFFIFHPSRIAKRTFDLYVPLWIAVYISSCVTTLCLLAKSKISCFDCLGICNGLNAGSLPTFARMPFLQYSSAYLRLASIGKDRNVSCQLAMVRAVLFLQDWQATPTRLPTADFEYQTLRESSSHTDHRQRQELR